jgi:hypothetical protein
MSLLGHHIDRMEQYWSDDFVSPVPYYLEKNNNSKNLVICYGDSWTWGDHIGNADASKSISDAESRAQHIYANRLSEKLEADFINCALPGIFNYWIHDRLKILVENDIQRLSTQYQHIWIIVTLTEICRDFGFLAYLQEFNKFYNINSGSFKDILVQAEKFDFLKLLNISQQLPTNVKLIVGRNFTDTFEENKFIIPNLMPVPWSNILFEKQGIVDIPKISMMSFAVKNFDKFIKEQKLDSTEYKQWMNDEILPESLKVLDLLDKSMYNNKIGSRHPTEQGHVLWADYIYNYIYEQTRTQ